MKESFETMNEYDIKKLYVKAGVRYWEDSSINGVDDHKGDLIPCRDGDEWCPVIDIELGKIINWEKGVEADIHYKVCDDGQYTLEDINGEPIKEIEGYVPNMMCPGGGGFGDYIIMQIDEDGFISNWIPTFIGF